MALLEILKDLDLFSESIQFNASRQRLKKRTAFGAFITIVIFVLTFIDFLFQSYLYFEGQMDPKLRSQTFVSNDINIQLNNEMFGFDFFPIFRWLILELKLRKRKQNLYCVFASFSFTNGTKYQVLPLDIIKCKSPEFQVRFLPNPALVLANHQTILSYINLKVYRCQDVDIWKITIPNNCADPQQVDNFINKEPYRLIVKTQVSQYNKTSKKAEYQYKSQTFVNLVNTMMYNEFKMQNQVTKVQNGYLIQSEQIFTSPFSQTLVSQTFNRDSIIQLTGQQFISLISFDFDESVTYFNFQYPIYTEVLALCNSTLALMLLLGSFCRKSAQRYIRRDVFFILMKDFFSGTFLNILQHHNIINLKNETQQCGIKPQTDEKNTLDDEETKKNMLIRSISPKPSSIVFQQSNQCDNEFYNQQDHIQENYSSQSNEFHNLNNLAGAVQSKRVKNLFYLENQATQFSDDDSVKKSKANVQGNNIKLKIQRNKFQVKMQDNYQRSQIQNKCQDPQFQYNQIEPEGIQKEIQIQKQIRLIRL